MVNYYWSNLPFSLKYVRFYRHYYASSRWVNCLVGLVVLNATATLEVLGSSHRSSKKCYWVFLWNSQQQLGVWICARLMAIGSPPITWDLNIPANCGCTLVHLCLTLRGIQAWWCVCRDYRAFMLLFWSNCTAM